LTSLPAEGELIHTNDLRVHLGGDWWAEMTAKQAASFVRRKREGSFHICAVSGVIKLMAEKGKVELTTLFLPSFSCSHPNSDPTSSSSAHRVLATYIIAPSAVASLLTSRSPASFVVVVDSVSFDLLPPLRQVPFDSDPANAFSSTYVLHHSHFGLERTSTLLLFETSTPRPNSYPQRRSRQRCEFACLCLLP